jgi:hypothetical protein
MVYEATILHNKSRRFVQAELQRIRSEGTGKNHQEGSSNSGNGFRNHTTNHTISCTIPVRVSLHVDGITLPSFELSWFEGNRVERLPAHFVYNGFTVNHGLFAWNGGVSIAPRLAKKLASLVERWYWNEQRANQVLWSEQQVDKSRKELVVC